MQYSLISRVYPKWVAIEHFTQERNDKESTSTSEPPILSEQPPILSEQHPSVIQLTHQVSCEDIMDHVSNCGHCARQLRISLYNTDDIDKYIPYIMILLVLLLVFYN